MIESTDPKSCIILHFGEGDIGISDATPAEEGSKPMLVFNTIKSQPVGAIVDGIELKEFSVGMTFPKPESIDAMINHLVSFRAAHFPESNPIMTG